MKARFSRMLALRDAVAALLVAAGVGGAVGLAPSPAFADPLRLQSGQTDATAPEPVRLTRGHQQILSYDTEIERVSVGDPDVVDAMPLDGNRLRLLGLAPGGTSLSVWLKAQTAPLDYDIAVGADVGGLQQAYQIRPKLSGLAVDALPSGKVQISGRVASIADHATAMTLARAHAGEGVVDLTAVTGRRTVAVDVRFAAVSASRLKALGFDVRLLGRSVLFANTGPGSAASFSFASDGDDAGFSLEAGLPIGDAFNLFVGSPRNDVLTILSALSSSGLAQILAEPTLVVRNGEDASFLAGGEVPIPVPGDNGTIGIEYRPFGVRLEIAATVLDDERIVLDVAPEVSELDFGNALSIQGISVPAFRKRAASTSIELRDGESFVLAGLMFSTSDNVDERIPGLGDIPILGAFFKRVRLVRERQELIIIATPHLVDPIRQEELPPLPGEALRGYQPSLGQVLVDRDSVPEAVARFGLIQ